MLNHFIIVVVQSHTLIEVRLDKKVLNINFRLLIPCTFLFILTPSERRIFIILSIRPLL